MNGTYQPSYLNEAKAESKSSRRFFYRLPRHYAGFFSVNGFDLFRYFRHYCYLGLFSHIDFSLESRAVLHDDTAAEYIASDIGALGERDHALTVDVSNKLS